MSVLDRFRLDGKRLLVTGGSRGFGRVIALAAAEAGADVVLVARDPGSPGQDRSRGTGARPPGVDLRCRHRAARGMRRPLQASARRAEPDRILVNNVGGRNVDVAIENADSTDLAAFHRSQSDPLLHLHEDDRRRDARARGGAGHQHRLDQRSNILGVPPALPGWQ